MTATIPNPSNTSPANFPIGIKRKHISETAPRMTASAIIVSFAALRLSVSIFDNPQTIRDIMAMMPRTTAPPNNTSAIFSEIGINPNRAINVIATMTPPMTTNALDA